VACVIVKFAKQVKYIGVLLQMYIYIYIHTSEFLDIPALYNYIGFGKFWGAVARLHLPCFQTW